MLSGKSEVVGGETYQVVLATNGFNGERGSRERCRITQGRVESRGPGGTEC